MKKVLYTSFSLLLAVSAGCTANQPKGDCAPKMVKNATLCADSVITAMSDAAAAKKKAGSVGGEWRDTGKMLKKAQAKAKEGNCSAAAKLAKKAHSEATMGYEQAMSQKTLKMPGYFKF